MVWELCADSLAESMDPWTPIRLQIRGHMCKYSIANSAAMNVPLLGISVEPLRFRRVLEDVAKDAGYIELTTDQVGVITTFVQGKDVFVTLSTSSGKSVCFALLRDCKVAPGGVWRVPPGGVWRVPPGGV